VYRVITPEGVRMTSLPFPRVPIEAVAGNRFYFGPADSYELQVYGMTGQLQQIIRLPQVRRQVTEEDISGFRREQLERAGREGTRPAMERMLSQMPYPEIMPPYSRLLVDVEGNIWVADYLANHEAEQTWRVFSPEGFYFGTVSVPSRMEVLQIGSDFVLGRSSDDLDVEYIQFHSLTKL
jgi:hypothetical protein